MNIDPPARKRTFPPEVIARMRRPEPLPNSPEMRELRLGRPNSTRSGIAYLGFVWALTVGGLFHFGRSTGIGADFIWFNLMFTLLSGSSIANELASRRCDADVRSNVPARWAYPWDWVALASLTLAVVLMIVIFCQGEFRPTLPCFMSVLWGVSMWRLVARRRRARARARTIDLTPFD